MKLKTVDKKVEILKNSKIFRGKGIFASEILTQVRYNLLCEAKKLARNGAFKFVWSRNGSIFIRKDETAAAVHIPNILALKPFSSIKS